MTYMCKMYGHTFAAYDVTQQIIIKGIHDKMKILQDIIPAGTVIGLHNGSRSGQTRVPRAPLEFIGTISKNLFGLATTKVINILKQHIVALETQPETFKGFQKFEQQLSSALIETNENLKRIHEDIIQNRKHINDTFNELDILERTLTIF